MHVCLCFDEKMSNYSALDGKLYCKPHFEQLFKETGSFTTKKLQKCQLINFQHYLVFDVIIIIISQISFHITNQLMFYIYVFVACCSFMLMSSKECRSGKQIPLIHAHFIICIYISHPNSL